MTDQQFRRALVRLGLLTQGDAARVIGISRRSVIRYSKAGGVSPAVVDRVIELLQEYGIPKRLMR
jgi:predicted transcriptional regulator